MQEAQTNQQDYQRQIYCKQLTQIKKCRSQCSRYNEYRGIDCSRDLNVEHFGSNRSLIKIQEVSSYCWRMLSLKCMVISQVSFFFLRSHIRVFIFCWTYDLGLLSLKSN